MPNGAARPRQRLASALRLAVRSERVLTLAGAAIVAIVLLATIVLPYLDEQRRVATEVPQPAPLFAVSLVELTRGQRACADQIGLLPGRQVAEMRVGTFGKPSSPLDVTLLGPGYREDLFVPATAYQDNTLLDVPFTGPRRVLEGSVCVANRGPTRVALYAAADRTQSRSATLVDGKLWPSNFDLAFFAARHESLLDRAQAILERMRIFHAHLGLGLLWILAILYVFGVAAASVAALVVGSTVNRSSQLTRAKDTVLSTPNQPQRGVR
jgi:hypothetical protein